MDEDDVTLFQTLNRQTKLTLLSSPRVSEIIKPPVLIDAKTALIGITPHTKQSPEDLIPAHYKKFLTYKPEQRSSKTKPADPTLKIFENQLLHSISGGAHAS